MDLYLINRETLTPNKTYLELLVEEKKITEFDKKAIEATATVLKYGGNVESLFNGSVMVPITDGKKNKLYQSAMMSRCARTALRELGHNLPKLLKSLNTQTFQYSEEEVEKKVYQGMLPVN